MAGKLALVEPGARRDELASVASDMNALLASLGAMLVTHMGVFHDAAGKLVPQSEWTPEMWACVRRVKYGEDGNVEWLEMFDRLSVVTILLRAAAATGKGSSSGTDLADILGEFDVDRVPRAPAAPLAAGGSPVDVDVAPLAASAASGKSSKPTRAERKAARQAAWAASPLNANNRGKRGG